MAKKHVKKAEKAVKHVLAKSAPKRRLDKHVIYIGILVIIVAIGLYFMLTKAPSKDVIAIVNGQEITPKDVELTAKFLSDSQRASSTEEQLLNTTIDETLLLQEARGKGIAASSEEVDAAIQEAISRSGLSQADADKYLSEKGITKQDLNTFFTKQVIFAKLIAQTPELQITVSEEEINSFYEQNKAQIAAPYEAAKEQIRTYLQNNKLALAFGNHLNRLRADAEIKIIKK